MGGRSILVSIDRIVQEEGSLYKSKNKISRDFDWVQAIFGKRFALLISQKNTAISGIK